MIQAKDADEKTMNKKKEDIYFLFKIIADEFAAENSLEKYNRDAMFKSMLALSLEIVFFVHNIEDVQFADIEQ